MTVAETPIDTQLLCRSTDCGHQQAAGALLCASHWDKAGQQLAQIGELYGRLDAAPSMQGKEPNTGSSGALAAHKSVGNLDVMVLRDPRSRREGGGPDDNNTRGAYETLAYWASAVRQAQRLVLDRQQLAPVRVNGLHHGPVCAGWCDHDTCRAATLRATANVRRTIKTERKLLADHLDWIVAQDCAGQFADEIRVVWQQLRSAVGDTGSSGQRRYLVPCPACQVRALVASVATGTACCQSCGHTASAIEMAVA